MDKWEYPTISAITRTELDKELNALGAAGWEAVSVQWIHPGAAGPAGFVATLKRREQ